MSHITAVLFDLGGPMKLPGLGYSYPAALFPVWGSFTFIDMALANVASAHYKKRLMFARKEKMKLLASHVQRWSGPEIPVFSQDILPDQFMTILNEAGAENLLIYNIANVFLLNPEDIVSCAGQAGKDILKFSLNEIPVEMYLISKKQLKSALHSAAKKYSKERPFGEFLFGEVLSDAFDSLVSLQGEMIYTNNLLDFFTVNFKVLSGSFKAVFDNYLFSIPQPVGKDTLISKNGWVKNSFIAQGGRVDGYVENSVIFENVHIKEKATVVNSVIMSGNSVGKNASIINSMIFPYTEESQLINTIGENATIGTSGSKATNRDFPEHLSEGLALIGLNPAIPDNCTVEPGCFIDADIPSSKIKSLKIIKRGGSVIKPAGDVL